MQAFIALIVAATALVGATAAIAAPGDNVRISLSDSEAQPANESTGAAMSADGRFVLFTSQDALSGIPVGNVLQLYVRDRVDGTTRLVSANAAGVPANAAVDESVMDHPYAISGDGRYAAFASVATNLIDNDTNAAQKDVFVKDLQTGTVTVASVNDAGEQANVGVQGNPDISGDGRRVVFVTGGNTTNLFPNDTNNAMDIVVRDLDTGQTLLASQSTAGVLANNFTERPAISADGRAVVFEAFMGTTNLVADDDNAQSDIFVRDLAASTTTRASLTTAGNDPGGTNFPDISGTGRFVVFQTSNQFDQANDANAFTDIYLRDLTANTTTLVSAVNGATTAGNGDSREPQISADGLRVAFQSGATTLVAPDGNAANSDAYVREIGTTTTQRASAPQKNNASTLAAISGNGAFVGFNYNDNVAFPFMAGDSNQLRDVFAHEFAPTDATGPTFEVTEPADGTSTDAAEIAVAGSASDPSGIVSVAVGGESVASTFSRSVALVPGVNAITITATDGAGNTTTESRSVTRLVDSAAPQTTIVKAPKRKVKTKKRKAKFRVAFLANEAATFECSLDGKSFTPCSSPVRGKVRKGKHNLRVVATDAAGNREASPAQAKWKVKRKKRKARA